MAVQKTNLYKNFAAQGLGISGRQSELIELALTYAFRGLDIDITETYRRVQRSSFDNAARFLNAAEITVGGFDVPIDLDLDDDAFKVQLGQFNPAAEVAGKLGAKVANINVPAATDRLPYHECFEDVSRRLNQLGDVLGNHGIRLAVGFDAAVDVAGDLQYEFIRKVEGFLPLIKGIGGNVGFLIDTFNWFAGDGGTDQLAEISVDQIFSVRLSGMSDQAVPGSAKVEDRTLPLSGGSIDFVAFLKRLCEGGYEGPITPYSAPSPVRGGTREKVTNQAQEALDEIFTGAGLHVDPRPMDTINDIQVDLMEP